MTVARALGRALGLAAAVVGAAASLAQAGTAQTRPAGVSVQGALTVGASDFAAAGVAVTGHLGVAGRWGVYARYTDLSGLARCSVEDAPSECNVDPSLGEGGLHVALGRSEKVAPWVTVGVGRYGRSGPQGDPSGAPAVAVSFGLDLGVGDLLAVRVSAAYVEVFSGALRDRYDGGVRTMSTQVGLALVTW